MNRRKKFDWRKSAERLAAALPIDRFDPAVRRWVEGAARSRARWHVALSGGADSVALLLVLWAHWPERRRRLHVLHYDHRLRGAAAARGDRDFCRRLCTALGLKLTIGEWKRARPNQRGPAISEAEARLARMAFFEKHARVLWLGHQQDDVAETMLMRLARGSGAGGLAAPRPVQSIGVRRVHLRPLLGWKKADLIRFLCACGAEWREDVSNAKDSFFRNRVRRNVIPAWVGAAKRDAIAGAARSRELLEEDDLALETWLDHLAPIGRRRELRLAAIAGKPRALVRRAVHRWLLAQPVVFHLSRQAVDALVAAVERGQTTRHSLGSEQFAVIRRGDLMLENGIARRKFQRRVN